MSVVSTVAGFVAALVVIPSAGAQDRAADSLVALWIDSLGGMETYEKFRSATFTLTTELHDPTTKRLRWARPRYISLAKTSRGQASRIERWEGRDFIVQVFDGQTAGAWLNGAALPDTAKDMRESRYVTADVFYWFGLPFKLRDPGVYLHYRGRDDHGRHTVGVTFGEGIGDHQDSWFYYFTDGKAWPVEVQYIEEGKTAVDRTVWEDVRFVEGYPYVARRVWLNAEGEVTKVLLMSDVRFNTRVRAESFSRP